MTLPLRLLITVASNDTCLFTLLKVLHWTIDMRWTVLVRLICALINLRSNCLILVCSVLILRAPCVIILMNDLLELLVAKTAQA